MKVVENIFGFVTVTAMAGIVISVAVLAVVLFCYGFVVGLPFMLLYLLFNGKTSLILDKLRAKDKVKKETQETEK